MPVRAPYLPPRDASSLITTAVRPVRQVRRRVSSERVNWATAPLRAARRPRGVVSATETRAALDAFRRALETGDLQGLLDLLAPDVVALSDGGGIKQAMPRPVIGAEKVARALAAGVSVLGPLMTAEPTRVNGHPALLMRIDGEVEMVVAMRIDDGLITGLYTVRNPQKLTRMEHETPLSR